MAQPSLDDLNAMAPDELAAQLAAPPERRAANVRTAAEGGVAEAQAVYGQMLLDGIGVAADPREGLRWFCRAADQGHALAINMVGRCYELGWGVAVDKARAAAWYKAAALRGLDWGMYNYATLLALGDGVAEDREAALDWLRKAAAMGNAKAINFVGSFHEDGWVVARDMAVAAECYARAAAGGDFRGQFNHARMLAAAGQLDEAATQINRAATTATPRFRRQMLDYLDRCKEPELRTAGRNALKAFAIASH